VKLSLNSSEGLDWLLRSAVAVKERPLHTQLTVVRGAVGYRNNHIIPSVATGFFSFDSLTANSCNVSDSRGWLSIRSRIFYHLSLISNSEYTLMLPFISFFTTANAVDPRRSDTSIHDCPGNRGRLPNMVTRDSEASRNWAVLMPLSVIWTSW